MSDLTAGYGSDLIASYADPAVTFDGSYGPQFPTGADSSATSIAAATFDGSYGPQLPSAGPYLPGVSPLALGDGTPAGSTASVAPQSTSIFGSAASTVKSWYSSVAGMFGGGSPINSSGGTANIVQPGGQSTLQSRFASLFGTGSPAARGAAPQSGARSSSLLLLGGVALLALAIARRHR